MKRVCSILVLFVLLASLASAEQKEWTFMVFINADNNLDQFGVGDQQEMAKVGSNDFLNIITLIDREKGPATLSIIEKNNIKVLKDMGELDMGDYNVLVNFVKDTAKAYPAKHYALIIWNHGSGWKNPNGGPEKSGNIFKGISYDDSSGNHITTRQLGIAMADIKKELGHNLDILGMDACLMQMMEVAYAIKKSCDFVIASEETEPGDGYPYDGILGNLKQNTTPLSFCQSWVKAYVASYNNGSQGNSASTQSALDCSKLDALKDGIDGLSKASMAGSFAPQFKTALTQVQKFYYQTNVDLIHLVAILKASIKEEGFQTAANKLQSACKEAIVANGNCGATMKNAMGLAIYFPANSYSFSTEYNALAFAQDSLWDEMVQDFYKKSANGIIASVRSGNMSDLTEYVQSANSNNREVSKHLIEKINFDLFAENANAKMAQQAITLIQELKNK